MIKHVQMMKKQCPKCSDKAECPMHAKKGGPCPKCRKQKAMSNDDDQ